MNIIKNSFFSKVVTWVTLAFFFCMFVVMIVVFFFGLIFPGRIGASRGSHTGVVTAVEYNSNLIWDANLVYFKTVRESSQEDIYCVNDPNVIEDLIQAQKSKRELTISFQNNYFMWYWDCNGGVSIITGVE